ncbi:MAG: Uma2 family endonuclease [Immundisolibacterales bacterium]|nr:Uma2 family endonuclease [Immundisolibacterales bacterium]
MSRLVRPPAAIDYPSSDGKPLAENDAQLHAILYAVGVLRLHYAERPDVYVSGDLLIYYEEGNPRVSVAPDAFVVFGVEDRVRMNYKVWEEGKGPDFVLEVASPNTWREDVERKPAVYAGLGVREYFLFDPLGEHLAPRLQGHRLVDGAYEPMAAVESIDRTLTLASEVLGLELRAKPGGEMRFHEPAVGRDLLGHEETHASWRAAEVRAERQATARATAEMRAEQEATAREAAEARAEQEATAREAAEARVAELEARLRDD